MNSILSEFQNEMDLLKLYIDFQDKSYGSQSKIESLDPNSVLKVLPISKIKQFNFNSHIISIYGAYESFVEQLLVKYLNEICSIISSYSSLPEEIKENNLKKTLEMIKQIKQRKNVNEEPEKIIEILHKNINENSSKININAFKNHNAIFRISIIDNYFSDIGIKTTSSLVRKYEPLKTFLEDTITDCLSKKNNVVFQCLGHICDLRNDISHGEKNIQLINKSILFEYIDFMKIFTSSLFELINDNYLSKVYEQNADQVEVINIYDNKILCFNTKGKEINKNSKVLVKSDKNFPKIFFANIVKIEHNNESINSTELNNKINIGVQVDKKITTAMNFKLVETKG